MVSLGQQRDETQMPWQRRAVPDMRAGTSLNIQKQQPYGCVRKIAEFTKGSNEIRSAQTQLQYCGAALDLCHKLTVQSKGKCLLFKEHGDQPCSPDHKTDRSLSLLIQLTAY